MWSPVEPEPAYNYCSVKTSDSKLVFKAMGIQGGVIDEFVMTK